MDLINCAIIDDDDLDRLSIEILVKQYPFLNLKGSFCNPLDCLDVVQKQNVQLLFLDVDMPFISGFEFLKSFKTPPLCIFITAHPEYAVDGFDLHALDFLVKPVKAERLEKSVMRAREYLQVQDKAKLYDVRFADDFLIIKESHDLVRIKMSDIIYLEALKDYTKIVTAAKTYLTLSNLKNFFEKLPESKFLRIHRSFAVAISQIRKLEHGELLLDNLRLPVGKTFKNDINKALLKI